MKQLIIAAFTAITITVAGCSNNTGSTTAETEAPARVPVSLSEMKQDRDALSDQPATAPSSSEVRIDPAIPSKNRVEKSAVVSMDQQGMSPGLAASMPVAESAVMPLNHFVGEDRENYHEYDENRLQLAREQPVSTFSIDVDTASYSNVRRMLAREGRLPPMDAVRVEELVNYFSYDYPNPDNLDVPFSVTTEVSASPWNGDRYLMQIGIRGYEPVDSKIPRANLVFLIDVSGSMMDQDKLPLVKQSLRMLVDEMDDDDRIALVVYAGAAGLVLDSTPASDRAKIHRAIEALQAGGSTNGGAGLDLAYRVAKEHYMESGINRVIIASDGDMNVGIVDHDALTEMIETRRKTGIALTTLGFGTGNYNYALMEQLADIGDGNAAYIDNILEARKVLVKEMRSTLLTIARDVKIQVEFNPALVSEYRLIGYENRILNREDFRNDKVDAGDIGAGHTVTAFYEVSLAGSSGDLVPQLRYGIATKQSEFETGTSNELAFVSLRYKHPGSDTSREIGQPVLMASIQESLYSASENLRFAAAVAGFGQILRGGRYTGEYDLDQVLELARNSRGNDSSGYRSEFLRLVELAATLSRQG